MALFGRTDLPIQKNAASRFIQWLVMVLVFMAAIAATVNAYTGSLLAHWNRSVTGTLTVQVPAPMEKPGKPNDVPKDVAAVLGVLKIHPDVLRVEAVPRAKVVALLEPWLGSGEAVSDLPLPALVDVALKPGTDTRGVTDAIMKAAPTALVDDHRVWLNRVGNLAATAVVDRQTQPHPRILAGGFIGPVDFPIDALTQCGPASDHREPQILSLDLGSLFDQVLFEQLHEQFLFERGSLPVFAAEAIQRQLLDIQPRTAFDDGTNRCHPASMSFDPGQAASLSPAPVPIHDDGHVTRQVIGAQTKGRDLLR